MRDTRTKGCDTRTMGIIHAALRRDLERATMVLEEPASLSEERLAALGTHMVWVMDFLHHHHAGEDAWLYPELGAQNPEAADLVRRMHDEHLAMVPSIDRVTQAAQAAQRSDGTVADRAARLLESVAGLRTLLEAHLFGEENDAMPVVGASVSQRRWDDYEAKNRAQRSPRELACTGHWLLDGLAAADATLITSTIPAVPRFVLQRLMGGPYRRIRESVWGGTVAASIGAVPLAPA